MGINICIDKEIFKVFPEFSVAAFACDTLPMEGCKEHLAGADKNAYDTLSTMSLEGLASHERIDAWRKAYRAMGLKPAEFRSSIEQLVRRGLRSSLDLTSVWPVELYNRYSVAWLAPMGGYDLDQITDRELNIRPADSSDNFEPLGGGSTNYALNRRVFVYAIDRSVLCWALNHRDAAGSALTHNTRRALFVSEAVDIDGSSRSLNAISDLRETLIMNQAKSGTLIKLDRLFPRGTISID